MDHVFPWRWYHPQGEKLVWIGRIVDTAMIRGPPKCIYYIEYISGEMLWIKD